MRIGLQTWGTEGDVRPFFALAQALVARGHQVKLLYSNVEGRTFDALGAACGIDARSVGGDYFLANRHEVTARMAEVFAMGNPLRQLPGMLEAVMDPIVDVMLDAALGMAKETDAMVGHFIAHTAGAAAAAHGKPYVLVSLAPLLPSVHYPPIGLPDLGRLFNPLLWKVLARVLESAMRDRVNRTRGRAGLPEVRDLMASILDHAILVITAVSPSLFARPADWDPRLEVTGFLGIAEAAEPWEQEPGLRAFLDAGPPPAFLSFGSMLNLGGDGVLASVRAMVRAVELAGARAIIQAPAAVAATFESDPRICFITRAPHAQLFPLCSVIVHHGGAGTTQSATLAGRPSVVVPHGADQFFWGARLHARGLGAKPLGRTKLTAERLAKRLRATLDDAPMRARAEEAAVLLRAEDGPAKAAERIEAALMAQRSAR
jgi:UDP:flavonoid glycosyltransferase YjiC (YdhE family)